MPHINLSAVFSKLSPSSLGDGNLHYNVQAGLAWPVATTIQIIVLIEGVPPGNGR